MFLLPSEPLSCARIPPPPSLVKEGLACEIPFLSDRDPAEGSSNNHQKQDKPVLLDTLVPPLVIVGAVVGLAPLREEGHLAR